jgi:hypothetical protein
MASSAADLLKAATKVKALRSTGSTARDEEQYPAPDGDRLAEQLEERERGRMTTECGEAAPAHRRPAMIRTIPLSNLILSRAMCANQRPPSRPSAEGRHRGRGLLQNLVLRPREAEGAVSPSKQAAAGLLPSQPR